jgi:hypothetical protein
MPEDIAVLHNDLERLADIAQHEIAASKGSVHTRFSPEARAAYEAITAHLIAAGYDRVIAEWATTCWVVGYQVGASVRDCVAMAEQFAELGLIHPAGGGDRSRHPRQ